MNAEKNNAVEMIIKKKLHSSTNHPVREKERNFSYYYYHYLPTLFTFFNIYIFVNEFLHKLI